jgi:RNA polymerase sigma-70 factor (ECF subfamily)
MRSEQEVSTAIDLYSDTVKRLCVLYLKNHSDTEDVFQTVFLKYALSTAAFENPEHEKSWIIRVTINTCKDWLKSLFHSRTTSLNEILDIPAPIPPDYRDVLEAVLSLPQKYKDVIYLHYYEGYPIAEVARMVGASEAAVTKRLSRARTTLRHMLGDQS